jgi:hypothetical protein
VRLHRDSRVYKVDRLKLSPPLPAKLAPGVFVSGLSELPAEVPDSPYWLVPF